MRIDQDTSFCYPNLFRTIFSITEKNFYAFPLLNKNNLMSLPYRGFIFPSSSILLLLHIFFLYFSISLDKKYSDLLLLPITHRTHMLPNSCINLMCYQNIIASNINSVSTMGWACWCSPWKDWSNWCKQLIAVSPILPHTWYNMVLRVEKTDWKVQNNLCLYHDLENYCWMRIVLCWSWANFDRNNFCQWSLLT